MGKRTIITISKRKVADIPKAMSISSASITGAMAAMAEPPQIPVPAEMRLDIFQLSFKSRPDRYPSPKHVAKVKIMTKRELRPTVRTVAIFKLAPSSIMANFNIFFDVNFIPGAIMFPG